MHLLKLLVKATGKKGLSQGGVLSPVLSNLYLNEVDRMLERAQEVTRRGAYTYLEYARFADDLVILVNADARHGWLLKAVNQRLREELAKLQVEVNEEKSRYVDLAKGDSFGFLGFEFRRIRSLQGKWRPYYPPKLKQRTVLLRKLKDIFRRFVSQPVDRVVQLINPIVRGWVNYFAIGDARRCFSFVQHWLEKKVADISCGLKSDRASAGKGGVDAGSMTILDCSTTFGFATRVRCRKHSQRDTSHNP
jgi:RNA-directed DNA polymerase